MGRIFGWTENGKKQLISLERESGVNIYIEGFKTFNVTPNFEPT